MKSICLRREIHLLAWLLAYSPARLLTTKKVSKWVYWKVFCHFGPIKLRDLSRVVSVAPIFPRIFFCHSIYGMALRFLSIQGEGVHFYVCERSAGEIFFQLKAKYPVFHFGDLDGTILNLISRKLTNNVKISTVF